MDPEKPSESLQSPPVMTRAALSVAQVCFLFTLPLNALLATGYYTYFDPKLIGRRYSSVEAYLSVFVSSLVILVLSAIALALLRGQPDHPAFRGWQRFLHAYFMVDGFLVILTFAIAYLAGG